MAGSADDKIWKESTPVVQIQDSEQNWISEHICIMALKQNGVLCEHRRKLEQ